MPRRPYDEEDVRYDSFAAGITLAGTLTTPREKGPHPAALLITGSGPHDRDETVLGHRPFLVLADHLTRAGLAVLRADDRGVGESSGQFQTATTADFADDARGAVRFLQRSDDIRSDQIGLIGHSDGAVIAVTLAAGSSEVAWVVLMAGPALPGVRILLAQLEAIAAANGTPKHVRSQLVEFSRPIYEVVKSELDDSAARSEVERLLANGRDSVGRAPGAVSAAADQVEAQMSQLLSPWFRDFLRSDPGAALRKLRTPVLAVSGELDVQVPTRENLPALAAALEASQNPDYAVVKLPRLNHLFQTASTGSPSEYEKIEETVAPVALETIASWIRRQLSLEPAASG